MIVESLTDKKRQVLNGMKISWFHGFRWSPRRNLLADETEKMSLFFNFGTCLM